MPNSSNHVYAGEVTKLGSQAHLAGDEQNRHLSRLLSETENLDGSFQCTAADVNRQGVQNAADRTNSTIIQRLQNTGDSLHTAGNVISGAIGDTTHVMMQQLNV
jgi:hypothetical protein